jgi:hypothetical protein
MAGLDDEARTVITSINADKANNFLSSPQAGQLRQDAVDAYRKRAGLVQEDRFITPSQTLDVPQARAGEPPGASGSGGPSTQRTLFDAQPTTGFTLKHERPDGSVVDVVPSNTAPRAGQGAFDCIYCGRTFKRPSGKSTEKGYDGYRPGRQRGLTAASPAPSDAAARLRGAEAGGGAGAAVGTYGHGTREGGFSERACAATYFARKYHNEQLGEARGRTASAPARSAGTECSALPILHWLGKKKSLHRHFATAAPPPLLIPSARGWASSRRAPPALSLAQRGRLSRRRRRRGESGVLGPSFRYFIALAGKKRKAKKLGSSA